MYPFDFRERVYHPPDGPVNVMLSFGYSLLYNRISAMLVQQGFNPRLGFFHVGRGAHAALASDLIEPLRHLVERIVLSLIHKKEIRPEHFTTSESGHGGECRLTDDGFRTLIHRYEKTMAGSFNHEGENVTYNAYLDSMAEMLKRVMQLDLPYQPLRIR